MSIGYTVAKGRGNRHGYQSNIIQSRTKAARWRGTSTDCESTVKCIFTGAEADTEEHVIPAWLQRRFKLENQELFIPNGTTLRYKFHRVPAEGEANRLFGNIENRISQGVLNPAEVYLWALKLHIGCIHRDSSLRFDIKDRNSPSILDVSDFDQEIWIFRQLFDNWRSSGTTHPSPFGSVFIVDSLAPSPEFDFVHCLVTGTVAIDIGGKFILVFLWDQGDAARTNILAQWAKYHAPRVKSLAGTLDFEANCYLAPHVWACESAYWMYRHRRPFSMIKTPTQIVLVPPMSAPVPKAADENEYRQVCRNFGLELIQYNGGTSKVYGQFNLRDEAASAGTVKSQWPGRDVHGT